MEIKAGVWSYMTATRIGQIVDFQNRYKLRNRSEAINQLIELAFAVEKRIGETESWTPEIVKNLREQIENGQLVDWFMTVPDDKFRVINDIVRAEYDSRRMRKK